jgi:two-component system, chemotaxis family, protein-glutamate methylesterase/glutaminase
MTIIAASRPTLHSATAQRPIRVMVVDDAVVVRGLIARWVESEPGLEVVAALRSGREAIAQIAHVDPDVVILDVDMPDMDGITALPRLLAVKPDLVVIMASTLTRRNAEISLRALSLGAADYIPKPETTREVTTSETFRRDLVEKIRALGSRRKKSPEQAREATPAAPSAIVRPVVMPMDEPALSVEHPLAVSVEHAPADHSDIKLRPFPPIPPRVLLIGASTGGPQALNAVVAKLNRVIDEAPVLIVQHMPPTFTTIFAEHLSRASGRVAHEGVDGEPVRAGQIYIAPGGKHMHVDRRGGEATIAISDGPMVNFCTPSVDPLFSSAAEVWGAKCLALVLTGMGCDGTVGAAELVAAGGAVIAQDEATSVVWGMPGSVTHAGLCSSVLPLERIAPAIIRLFSGGRL